MRQDVQKNYEWKIVERVMLVLFLEQILFLNHKIIIMDISPLT